MTNSMCLVHLLVVTLIVCVNGDKTSSHPAQPKLESTEGRSVSYSRSSNSPDKDEKLIPAPQTYVGYNGLGGQSGGFPGQGGFSNAGFNSGFGTSGANAFGTSGFSGAGLNTNYPSNFGGQGFSGFSGSGLGGFTPSSFGSFGGNGFGAGGQGFNSFGGNGLGFGNQGVYASGFNQGFNQQPYLNQGGFGSPFGNNLAGGTGFGGSIYPNQGGFNGYQGQLQNTQFPNNRNQYIGGVSVGSRPITINSSPAGVGRPDLVNSNAIGGGLGGRYYDQQGFLGQTGQGFNNFNTADRGYTLLGGGVFNNYPYSSNPYSSSGFQGGIYNRQNPSAYNQQLDYINQRNPGSPGFGTSIGANRYYPGGVGQSASTVTPYDRERFHRFRPGTLRSGTGSSSSSSDRDRDN